MEETTFSQTGEPVTIEAKREYMGVVCRRYRLARKRADKTRIIDEVVANLEIHRKAAIRLLKHDLPSQLQKGCGGCHRAAYSEETRQWLVKLWHRMCRMNSTKMREALPIWLPYFIEEEIPQQCRVELLRMSARTIERFLKEEKSRWRRHSNAGTMPSRHVAMVPVRGFCETPTEPGHIEIDTVAHCGGMLLGKFAWTLTATDIFSGWTGTVAFLGKDGAHVREALFELENDFPFKWKALYFDNGSEFLNDDVLYGFARLSEPSSALKVYRGRPYKKNDQAHVEQKNWTHVRELWGYERISDRITVKMMNTVARGAWQSLQNFFVPQQKVIRSERHGARKVRKLDRPQTPYDRLMACEDAVFSNLEKSRLVETIQSLNPFTLRLRLKQGVYNVFRSMDLTKSAPRRYAS